MKKNARNYNLWQRLGALCLAMLMAVTMLPTGAVAAGENFGVVGEVTTVSDPDTIRRHDQVYGNNTENAGKVTVGKSVSDDAVTINYGNTSKTFTPGEDNFIVTASQTAQVMGLASESTAPVDVVFVLDTSNSMQEEVGDLVTAANNAIKTLLQANPNNRIGVVAFSGTQGGGTSGGAAANVLSPLAHYDDNGNDKAETEHLRRVTTQVNQWWSTTLLTGRGSGSVVAGTRNPTSQGTNIHAGVVAGARLLENAQNITVNGVTRIPFLVVMSDGQPSYASSDANWYNPDLTKQTNTLENASGTGFLPALTAAYYKAKITEHYFGSNANKDHRCFIYTVGLGLESHESKDLALMTVNPSKQTNSNDEFGVFEGYWNSYVNVHNSTNANASFTIDVGNNFTIRKTSVDTTWNYVNGKLSNGTNIGYTGGYKYNDKYFSAAQASDLNNAFSSIVTTIQQQSMSAPTRVEAAHGEDFSGYVTYTDPIGEYMEVKGIHGVLANGNLYDGKIFAQYLQNWSSAPQELKTAFAEVLKKRCEVTGATMNVDAFLASAVASPNQAYYNSDTDFDNSLVWWGKSYLAAGEEDPHIQWIGAADNDTIEYLNDPATKIPAGADYVCRSYYFYGAADDNNVTDAENFLHFVVRVQRSLTAPYQQSVVISTPASLLSVEKVLITEKAGNNNTKTYTASVNEVEPARVVYEVGLRGDINAFTVDEIVGKDTAKVNATQTYAQETNHVDALANYDAATDTYTFYTNDWNRTEGEDEHHRAQTHVTFDAAENNSFYTYTGDTLIYVKDGNTYKAYSGTSKPSGSGHYYARTVYDWSADRTPTNGVYDATVRTEYIPITVPSAAPVIQKTGGWYVPAGTYKASSLTGGEDVIKSDNKTDTAVIISHPHRTEDATNSHYTVLLGNNGKLTLKAETTKKVDITRPDRTDFEGQKVDGVKIEDAHGKAVMVGDQLTYTIRVVNDKTTAATATVTDTIPAGTKFISADKGGSNVNGVVTWNNIRVPAAAKTTVDGVTKTVMGETTVSFVVEVTEDVVDQSKKINSIDNTATVTLSNSYSYNTNTTTNPPEGKRVTDSANKPITDLVAVPSVLTYHIRWRTMLWMKRAILLLRTPLPLRMYSPKVLPMWKTALPILQQ